MHYEDRNGLLLPKGKLIVGGTFYAKHIRDGVVIDEWEVHNLIVNQGLDHILATEFVGGAQITSWYLGLFGNNYVPTGTDTAANIATNAGEITALTSSGRVPYVGVEGGQQVSNAASPSNFIFSSAAPVAPAAGLAIYGAFMISSSAFGATTGTLFAASQFSAPKSMFATDTLALTYVFGAASA